MKDNRKEEIDHKVIDIKKELIDNLLVKATRIELINNIKTKEIEEVIIEQTTAKESINILIS